MKLYLLRHASAQDIATSDAARELTREGREEARVAGQALAALGCKPDYILTSPLVRARQTAELVAKELKFDNPILVSDELQNDTSTADLLRALRRLTRADAVLLVGHMPSLAGHVLALVGAKGGAGVSLSKGGLAAVELTELRAGAGDLRFLMRQTQLRALIA